MDIQVGSRNIRLTDDLEDFTRRKVDRLDRYLPNIREVKVDLARQNNSRGEDLSIAQITVYHSRGAILRVEEKSTGNIQDAVNVAVDKMHRQINRFKGKRLDNKRRKHSRYTLTPEELSIAEEFPMEAAEAEIEAEAPQTVVRRKQVNLIPMSEEEAIEQMELLGHTFFMFHNAETGQINLIYQRSENGYGLLEPTE